MFAHLRRRKNASMHYLGVIPPGILSNKTLYIKRLSLKKRKMQKISVFSARSEIFVVFIFE